MKSEGSVLLVETSSSQKTIPRLVLALADKGVQIEGLDVEKTDLNLVFLKHTSAELEPEEDEDAAKVLAREKLLRRG